ncbi:MAG TPA: OPT/YSL family transporter, partial [Acidobacteriaceae bacterium]|nr:OPT/YSL family transporter [Acidobacteriaceae bacterium]
MASNAGPSNPPADSHPSASHAASPTEFQPYVKPNDSRPEFTFRAIFLGCIFGILFGAVTVYVGLRAGLTVAASIP